MSPLSRRPEHRYFGRYRHPYTVLRRGIDLLAADLTRLDAGCGHRAPTLVPDGHYIGLTTNK